MTMRVLDVWWNGRIVGQLTQNQHGELGFAYSPEWLGNDDAPPLSVSLPKRAEPFSRRECRPFFGGLLPEESQRDAAAQALGVPTETKYASEGGPTFKDCFALLRRVPARPAVEVLKLLDAVIFNPIVGNADARGKNFRSCTTAMARVWRRSMIFSLRSPILNSPRSSKCGSENGRRLAKWMPRGGRRLRPTPAWAWHSSSDGRKGGAMPGLVDIVAMAPE